MSMSVSVQKSPRRTNINHNNRTMTELEKLKNDHIDYSKSDENIYLVQNDIKQLYQDEFSEALEKYNAKQKRSDRKIDNYYEHIKASKKTFTQQEMIVQVGDKNDFSLPENKELANEVLKEWFEGFQERNPNLKVYNAVIHNDEASPHIHLNFVPVADGYKRGLEKQVSFDKALIQQNSMLDKERPFGDWRESEVAVLEKLLQERGVQRKLVGKTNYKDVNDYKDKKDLEREIAELEHKISEKKSELLAFSERVPVSGNLQIKTLGNEVITKVTSKFLGKPEIVKEKTRNVIVEPEEMRRANQAVEAGYYVQREYNRLLKTDIVAQNHLLFDQIDDLKANNKQLVKENNALKAENGSLRAEIKNLYETTKDYLKERTSDFGAFKGHLKAFTDKLKQKVPNGIFERLYKAENEVSIKNLKKQQEQINQSSVRKKNRGMER